MEKMKHIKLTEENFDKIAPRLKPFLKNYCNYCGEKITGKTYGFLSRSVTACKSLLCLTLAVSDLKEIKKIDRKRQTAQIKPKTK